MNEFERRTLLGAAGLGALAAMSKAGPLNPPAGPVAPTGRTLDEVYDKIPPLPAAGSPGSPGVLPDGRIVLPGGTSPVFITQPGSYILGGNITASTANFPAIRVQADNVTLDLNGFTVKNTGGGNAQGVAVYNEGATIRNGTVRSSYGVASVGGVVIEDLFLLGCSAYAVYGVADHTTVQRCVVRKVTGAAGATGIQLQGDMNSVHDCEVNDTRGSNDPQGLTTYGIRIIGNGSSIARNRVCTLPGVVGTGIRTDGTGVFRDNSVQGYSVPYGTFGGTTNGGGNVTVF